MKLHSFMSNKNILKGASICSIAVLLCIQLFMIFWFNGPQVSDSASYIRLAKNSISTNSFYPNPENIHDRYIFAPGLVNLLILLFSITTNIKIVYIVNCFLVFVILFSMRYIIIKLFNNIKIFFVFSVLFCLFPTFWGEIVRVRTEIPYTALSFLGFAVLLKGRKTTSFTAGVILALANWIRPLAIAYLIGMFVYLFLKKSKKNHYILLLSGFLVAISIIGTVTFFNFKYFVFQSSTAGINLIMGANDDADGGYDNTCFQEGKIAYLSQDALNKMTFKEKDKYYKDLALSWIANHPIKWLSLFPAKLFVLYSSELYIRDVFFQADEDFGVKELILRWIRGNIQFPDIILIYCQLLYMFIFVMFCLNIISSFRTKTMVEKLPLLSIFLIGTMMTIITVGGARYHFPYLPIIMVSAALEIMSTGRFVRQHMIPVSPNVGHHHAGKNAVSEKP